jgi:lactate dehydrogenase-like 2-hydroxyacid dehydrogenase
MAIALARQLPWVMEKQRNHQWALDELEASRSVRTLQKRRMGIIGLGSIGLEVAQAASDSVCAWAICKRVDEPTLFVERILPPDRLNELLASSDVIVLRAADAGNSSADQRRHARDDEARRVSHQHRPGRLIDDEAVAAALRAVRGGVRWTCSRASR